VLQEWVYQVSTACTRC